MAKMPTDAAAAAPPMIGAPIEAEGMEEDEAVEEAPLLTVFKNADGTYTLKTGEVSLAIDDGDSAETGVEAGSGEVEGEETADTGEQMFDNVGALMKAILDTLNEDAGEEGDEEGTADEQFEEGFAPAGAAGEKSLAQKY